MNRCGLNQSVSLNSDSSEGCQHQDYDQQSSEVPLIPIVETLCNQIPFINKTTLYAQAKIHADRARSDQNNTSDLNMD